MHLVDVLSGLSDDGSEVRITTASGTLSGVVAAVGADVVSVQASGGGPEMIYVPAASLYAVSVRLSG
jgi:hypothetical protein